MHKKVLLSIVSITIAAIAMSFYLINKDNLPIIAIANYGPHSTLETSINGLKNELAEHGFIENKTIRYEIADVGFDHAIIPQMISKLCGFNPKVMVVKATPVAQYAKGKIHNIPLVFCDITDPVEVGLLKTKNRSEKNITGSSDQENLVPFLNFAKKLLKNPQIVGILYSTSDSNDAALVKMMKQCAAIVGLTVISIPIDQSRDIPIRMQDFNKKVDFIYVGTSGPIQPALPTIAAEAQKMGIPVFNAGDQAVRAGIALASFGVNYESVGRNAGKLVVKLLNEADIKILDPIYPATEDYQCVVNRRLAVKFHANIPKNAVIVE